VAYQAAAARYAQAVFSLAVEQGTIAQWRSELADLVTVLGDAALGPMLEDSRIPLEQRLRAVERALDISPLALNLAKLLVSKQRAALAPEVAASFGRMADEHEGIVNARVTTAVELAPADLASIEQMLSQATGKRVRTQVSTDPNIIGGVVVRIGDRLIDGSVRTRLKLLRRQLQGAR
jgi:F-type H+-transporting ATPase subunit delta